MRNHLKHSVFFLLVLSLAISLTGCSTTEKKIQAKPDDALTRAAALHQQGDWASAINTLRDAHEVHPYSKTLQQTLENLENAWQLEKRSLYQKLLISETRGLLDQQEILQQINTNSKADLRAKAGLLLKDMQLNAKLQELRNCIDEQKTEHLEIARICSQLLNQIENTPQSKQLYNEINNAYQQAIRQTEQNRKQRSERQMLQEAKSLIEKEQYLKAHALLEDVLQLSPDNRQARVLIETLDSTLKQQAEILFSVGDQLYRDGQLEQAVAVWHSMLKLTPENNSIKARIERAEHVLNKLKSLRKEQSEQLDPENEKNTDTPE